MRFRPRGCDYASLAVERLHDFRHGTGTTGSGGFCGSADEVVQVEREESKGREGGGAAAAIRAARRWHGAGVSGRAIPHPPRPRPRAGKSGGGGRDGRMEDDTEENEDGCGEMEEEALAMTTPVGVGVDPFDLIDASPPPLLHERSLDNNDDDDDDDDGRSLETNRSLDDDNDNDGDGDNDSENDDDEETSHPRPQPMARGRSPALQCHLTRTAHYLRWTPHPFPVTEEQRESLDEFRRSVLGVGVDGGGGGEEEEEEGGRENAAGGLSMPKTGWLYRQLLNCDDEDEDENEGAAASDEDVLLLIGTQNIGGIGTCFPEDGTGGDDDEAALLLWRQAPMIRLDPELPPLPPLRGDGDRDREGDEEDRMEIDGQDEDSDSREDDGAATNTSMPASVLPHLRELVASGRWGPASATAGAGSSRNKRRMLLSEAADSKAQPLNELILVEPVEEGIRPPLPTVVTETLEEAAAQTEEDRIVECEYPNNNQNIENGQDKENNGVGEAVVAAQRPPVYSEEWLRLSKRRWRMQRSIRESNRIVEEQRLQPLRELNLLPQDSSSTSTSVSTAMLLSSLDNRIRIDADLPIDDKTNEVLAAQHRQLQYSADATHREVLQEIRQSLAPTSLIESERNVDKKIILERHRDPEAALREILADTNSITPGEEGRNKNKDGSGIQRPPCTLISQLARAGDEDANLLPPLFAAAASAGDESMAYPTPSLIRKDLPLPVPRGGGSLLSLPVDGKGKEEEIAFPAMTSSIKSVLPTTTDMLKLSTRRGGLRRTNEPRPPLPSLQDAISTARVVGQRSIGQLLSSVRGDDIAGLLIPQRPFPTVEAATSIYASERAVRANASEEDADLAAFVRSFLATTNESDRFAASNRLAMKGNGYESQPWFIANKEDTILPEYQNSADAVAARFHSRARARSMEDKAREMVYTGVRVTRKKGKRYVGFVTGIPLQDDFYEPRYLAMLRSNRALQPQHQIESGVGEGESDFSFLPRALMVPSASPMVSDTGPCPTAEAALRILHRSIARYNIQALANKVDGVPPPPRPELNLLSTRRHPGMIDDPRREERSKKKSWILWKGNSTNSKKRQAASVESPEITFHDMFVAKRRKETTFLDDFSATAIQFGLPSILSTLTSVEDLGTAVVAIRGELSHCLNKSLEVAKEEETYWREMAVGCGLQNRPETASRLAFSPKQTKSGADRLVQGVASGASTLILGGKENATRETSRIKGANVLRDTTADKADAVTADMLKEKEEKRERKKQRKREKKERKRQRKREKKEAKRRKKLQEDQNSGKPLELDNEEAILDEDDTPLPPSKKARSNESNITGGEGLARLGSGGSTSDPSSLGRTAVAVQQAGYTPKLTSVSNLTSFPESKARGNIAAGSNTDAAKPADMDITPVVKRPMSHSGQSQGRRAASLNNRRALTLPHSTELEGCAASSTRYQSTTDTLFDQLQRSQQRPPRSGGLKQPNLSEAAPAAPVPAAPTAPMTSLEQQVRNQNDQTKEEVECDGTIRSLCSEAFCEGFSEAFTDLSTGQWANGFREAERPEAGGAHELAGSGWGNSHTLTSQKLTSSSVKAIALYDSNIIDAQGVDIELPGKAGAIVALRLSSFQTAKDFQAVVRRLVEISSTGRYTRLHILISADVDLSPTLLSGIVLLQNNLVRQPGSMFDTDFQFVSDKTMAATIAGLFLDLQQGQGIGKWIEDLSSNEELLGRAEFFLSCVSSLTALEALEMARLPQSMADVMARSFVSRVPLCK